MKIAPIALFVYNRPWHTKKTVEALKKNHLAISSELFIFSDAPKNEQEKKNVDQVRQYIKGINGFKSVKIIERDRNLGLANSIISGVTEIINQYGNVVVMEDDLVSSEAFLNYMNNLLDNFEEKKIIFGITGYNHPQELMKIPSTYKADVYFNPRAGSWGWATWKDRWNKADWEINDYNNFKNNTKSRKLFDRGGGDMSAMLDFQMKGKIDSWAIRWCYTLFKNKGLFIYPVKSYINNIGLDGSGVHCEKSKKKHVSVVLNEKKELAFPESIKVNEKIINNFRKAYKRNIIKESIFKLIKNTCLYRYYNKIINNI